MTTDNPTSEVPKTPLQTLFAEVAPKVEPAVEVKGVEPKVALGAEVQKPTNVEAPKPRSYSEDEWNKRQSAWDKQVGTKEKEFKASQERLTELSAKLEELQSQSEEAKMAGWLQKVEADGGDVKIAQRIVEAQREVAKARKEAFSLKSEWETKSKVAEEGLKALAVEELIRTYKLDPAEYKEKLLEAKSPVEAENIALKAARETVPIKEPEKLAPATGAIAGIDLSKVPASMALGFLLEQEAQNRKP